MMAFLVVDALSKCHEIGLGFGKPKKPTNPTKMIRSIGHNTPPLLVLEPRILSLFLTYCWVFFSYLFSIIYYFPFFFKDFFFWLKGNIIQLSQNG